MTTTESDTVDDQDLEGNDYESYFEVDPDELYKVYELYANFSTFDDGEITAFYDGVSRLLGEGDDEAHSFYRLIFQSTHPDPRRGREFMIDGLRLGRSIADRLGVPWQGVDPDDETAITAARRAWERTY